MPRIRSQMGRHIALIPEAPGTGFSVVVTAAGVSHFNSRWPCSRLGDQPIRFEFDAAGNLVDIPFGGKTDGEELLALSHDAQEFGEKCRAKLAPHP